MPTPSELSRHEELSTKIKLFRGTRAARRQLQAELEGLGQQRNPPLPPELMWIIFNFYVHLYDQLPERLLLVCRAWHVLALSQPILWTNLDPLSPFGLSTIRPWAGTFLQSRIARSNPAPLKVDFSKFSPNIRLQDLKKIANISTFRSRIQDLTIAYKKETWFMLSVITRSSTTWSSGQTLHLKNSAQILPNANYLRGGYCLAFKMRSKLSVAHLAGIAFATTTNT